MAIKIIILLLFMALFSLSTHDRAVEIDTANTYIFEGKYEHPIGRFPHTIPIKFTGSGGGETYIGAVAFDTLPDNLASQIKISVTDSKHIECGEIYFPIIDTVVATKLH